MTYEVLKTLKLETFKDRHTKVNDNAIIKLFGASTSNYNENTNPKLSTRTPNEKAQK
jgi:hypothetical protein